MNKFLKTVEKQQLTKTLYLEILFCHASNMEPQVKKAFQLVTIRTLWGWGGGEDLYHTITILVYAKKES